MYSISNQPVIPRRPRPSRARRRFGAPATSLAVICVGLAIAALCAYAQTDPRHLPARILAHPRVLATPAPLPLPGNLDIPVYAPGPSPFRDGETLLYRTTEKASCLEIALRFRPHETPPLGDVHIEARPQGCGPARAKQLLDWESRMPFEDGLRRTIAWYRAERELARTAAARG